MHQNITKHRGYLLKTSRDKDFFLSECKGSTSKNNNETVQEQYNVSSKAKNDKGIDISGQHWRKK